MSKKVWNEKGFVEIAKKSFNKANTHWTILKIWIIKILVKLDWWNDWRLKKVILNDDLISKLK